MYQETARAIYLLELIIFQKYTILQAVKVYYFAVVFETDDCRKCTSDIDIITGVPFRKTTTTQKSYTKTQ